MRKLLIALTLLAACGDAVAPAGTIGTSPTITPTTVAASEEVIVEVHRGGGLCVDGPCSTTYDIFGDGRIEVNGVQSAVMPAPDLEALLTQLATGIGEVPAFTGICPEAYDGPRFTYRFGGTEIDSCISDVSQSELVRLIHAALELGSF